MSVFLWLLGQEICGVGATREEAERDALDRIFEQTIRPIEQAVQSMLGSTNLEGLVPSLDAFRMRGVVVEYGFVGSVSIEMGKTNFDAILIKQLRGQVERGVAVFPNTPPPMIAVPPQSHAVAPVAPQQQQQPLVMHTATVPAAPNGTTQPVGVPNGGVGRAG